MSIKAACNGLRLLLVGPYPPPYGGIASHLTMLIAGMRARGATDIAVVSFGTKDETCQLDGAMLYRFNARNHVRTLFSLQGGRTFLTTLKKLVGARFGFRQIVAEAVKAHLIHQIAEQHDSQVASFYMSNTSLAALSCKALWKNRRGIVLTVFGEVYDSPDFFSGRKAFVEKFLAMPQSVMASSKHCACSFARVIGASREIESVYYGIDLDRFSAIGLRQSFRETLGIMPDDVLLVFMGRFIKEMGVERLLDVGPVLLQKFSNIRLLFAGAKGPLSEAVAAFSQAYPQRVHILHDVPFELQPSIYSASDIVLAPSHDQHACMGMSIKEAMAASKPVVGSRAGGIPEAIVHGETGYLVSLDETKHVDGKEFAHYVELLTMDANLRMQMGQLARLRAERMFSMEQTMNRMSELFMDAIPAGINNY